MSDERIEVSVEDRNESAGAISRRDFLHRTMAMTWGLALSSMLPSFVRNAWAKGMPLSSCLPGPPLQAVGEIKSSGKVLKAILKVLDEKRTYLAPGCVPNTGQMRYIAGFDANLNKIWPTTSGVPSPAPTLRARLGDRIQITLLNHVNVRNFPGTLDVAEKGEACDQNVTEGIG